MVGTVPMKAALRFIEGRMIGTQRYELWTWTHMPESLYFFHLDRDGNKVDTWTHFPDPESAWAAAAHHSWIIAVTGHCDGSIPVRLSQPSGRVHLTGLESHHTVCGIGFEGPASRYRVPGSVRERGVVTCQRCR